MTGTRLERDDNRRLLRRVLFLRFATVVAILAAGLLVFTRPEDRSSLTPWVLLLAATTLFTMASWVAIRGGRISRGVVGAQLTADLAVAAAAVHLSGGYDSPFTFLYVLSVLSGAALLDGWGALAMGSAASATYGLLAVMEHAGRIVPPGTADGGWTAAPVALLATVLIQVIFFHASAALAAHVSEHHMRQGRAMRAKDLELREERLNLDTIIQSMRSGLVTVDVDGTIAHVNRAAEAILDCRREDVAGRHFREVIEPLCPDFAGWLDDALGRGETPARIDAVLVTQDREPTPIGLSISVLRGAGGESRGAVAIFQDLTEVKKMEERVRRADCLAAVGELSAAVAHEIRNPLASISGSVEILAAELEVTGDHRKLLDLILRESGRLKRITADFLSYGRLKSKEVSRTDACALVRELASHLQQHESWHPLITIRTELPAEPVFAWWDAEQLRQAFLNIGTNAMEAMPDGGTLTIRMSVLPWETPGAGAAFLARLPRAARIRFEDTGCGLAPDIMRRVFEPFFTTRAKGTGLGLAIVARIVEDHGGQIDLRSHPGEGTSFQVTLPGVAGDPGAMPASRAEYEQELTLGAWAAPGCERATRSHEVAT